MRRIAGLTITEVVIVLGILVVAVALLLPVLYMFVGRSTHAGGHHHQLQAATQVRGIHVGLVLYAQGNNSHYVGIKSDGVTIEPTIGLSAQNRIQRLIEDNYFTLEYARSTSEVQTGTTSYALLKVDVAAEGSTITKSLRNSEWNDTANANAVIISDRAVDNGTDYSHISSIHTLSDPYTNNWRGNIGWNDNHATFETTTNLTTKYGTASHTSDNLFVTPGPTNGDDAFMVWHGADKL